MIQFKSISTVTILRIWNNTESNNMLLDFDFTTHTVHTEGSITNVNFTKDTNKF